MPGRGRFLLEPAYGAPLRIEEVKAAGDAWEVSGYAATYGNTDLGGDVILPGAFDESLKSGRKVRFLYAHDHRQVLGVPVKLHSDDKGLFGRFKISKTRLGEEVHQLLKDGALDSFSIGFIPTDVEFDDADIRKLKSIDLLETSVVAMPMNPQALVTAVKAEDAATLPFAELWARITQSLKVGTAEAKALRDRRANRDSGWKDLSESHKEALRTGIAEAEALLEDLRALVVNPAPPQQAKAANVGAELLRKRLDAARRRLEARGDLEPPSP